MIGRENKLVQVKVSLKVYECLKKYSVISGISISRFCEVAITNAIKKRGDI